MGSGFQRLIFGEDEVGTVCKVCRKRLASEGKKWCRTCRDAHRIACETKMRRNEKRKTGEEIARRELVAAGVLCPCCKKRRRVEGLKTCNRCGMWANDSDVRLDDKWDIAVKNRTSGLRQRARYCGVDRCATFRQLRDKLILQEYMCFFTGLSLDVASLRLAHIVPASDGGTFDVDNLAWTSHQINRMMGTMTGQEFVDLCRKIAKNAMI